MYWGYEKDGKESKYDIWLKYMLDKIWFKTAFYSFILVNHNILFYSINIIKEVLEPPWYNAAPAAALKRSLSGGRNYFSHCSSGPPVHFTHQTLTISSFGYLLWRNKRHCYPFYYSQKKSQQEDLNSTLRTSSVMQCYTSLYPLHHEQLTAARVV